MSETYTELYEKLSRLQWLLQRQHLQSHAERGPMADRTRGQGRVLAMLKMQPEISTKDLSYLLGIRQQSLNELLNKLEKAGYVLRTPSEGDKRVMMVRLTEKGQAEQNEEPDYSGIFSCLSLEEQKNFSEYLDRVIAALETEIGLDEDDERETWMHDFRGRMGDERFETLYAMGGHRHPHGFGEADPRMERMRREFGAEHDGPMPMGGRDFPFGRHPGRQAPPSPPKPPEDE